MDVNMLWQGGIVLSILTSAFYMLKSVPNILINKIKNKIIYRISIYDNDEMFNFFERWLTVTNNSTFRNVEGKVRFIKRKLTFFTKQEENVFRIKIDGVYIWVSKTKRELQNAQSISSMFLHKYSISTWIKHRGKVEKLLADVVKEYGQDKKDNQVNVYFNTTWGEVNLLNTITTKSLNSIFLAGDRINWLKNDLSKFLTRKNWYIERGIPYKRGYLFYGPPGTGKSTLAMSMANYLDKDLTILSLNSISGEDGLSKFLSNLNEDTILLIEDIDCYFNGREIVSEKKNLSFSAFLNCLDGTAYKEGLITIITTNHIEKLDDALLRAGRMDVKIKLDYATSDSINNYLSTFYELNSQEIFTDGYIAMSEVQEICVRNINDYGKAIYQIINKIEENEQQEKNKQKREESQTMETTNY